MTYIIHSCSLGDKTSHQAGSFWKPNKLCRTAWYLKRVVRSWFQFHIVLALLNQITTQEQKQLVCQGNFWNLSSSTISCCEPEHLNDTPWSPPYVVKLGPGCLGLYTAADTWVFTWWLCVLFRISSCGCFSVIYSWTNTKVVQGHT